MDELVAKLKAFLTESDPADFKVVSVTMPTGETINYGSYKELLDAYTQAVRISSQESTSAFKPILLGRGSRL